MGRPRLWDGRWLALSTCEEGRERPRASVCLILELKLNAPRGRPFGTWLWCLGVSDPCPAGMPWPEEGRAHVAHWLWACWGLGSASKTLVSRIDAPRPYHGQLSVAPGASPWAVPELSCVPSVSRSHAGPAQIGRGALARRKSSSVNSWLNPVSEIAVVHAILCLRPAAVRRFPSRGKAGLETSQCPGCTFVQHSVGSVRAQTSALSQAVLVAGRWSLDGSPRLWPFGDTSMPGLGA